MGLAWLGSSLYRVELLGLELGLDGLDQIGLGKVRLGWIVFGQGWSRVVLDWVGVELGWIGLGGREAVEFSWVAEQNDFSPVAQRSQLVQLSEVSHIVEYSEIVDPHRVSQLIDLRQAWPVELSELSRA